MLKPSPALWILQSNHLDFFQLFCESLSLDHGPDFKCSWAPLQKLGSMPYKKAQALGPSRLRPWPITSACTFSSHHKNLLYGLLLQFEAFKFHLNRLFTTCNFATCVLCFFMFFNVLCFNHIFKNIWKTSNSIQWKNTFLSTFWKL